MFNFAWVEPEETTFGPEHEVEDEEVIGFEVVHFEGDFATLRIDIRNPREAFLGPSRKQLIWLSWTDPDNPTAGAVPLGLFRVIAHPEDLQSERITLDLIARPADYEELKAALAETLKEPPYWDPVFIAEGERENPDSVLEARTALWHIDRVSHDVTVSDIANGEDGTVTLTTADIIDLRTSYGDTPLRQVTVNGGVFWLQKAQGIVDIKDKLVVASKEAGSTEDYLIATYTGQGLASRWPQPGINIGGHWWVKDSSVYPADGIAVVAVDKDVTVQGLKLPASEAEATQLQAVVVGFRKWRFLPTFTVLYDTERQYSELATLTLRADIQPVITDPDDTDQLIVDLSSGDVAAEIDPDGTGFAMPIGDVKRRQYFTTDRGKQSVEYMIALARAILIKRARFVSITVEVKFSVAAALSCRKNITIVDDRLPGGGATGKVTGYQFSAVPRENGEVMLRGSITIGCLVGTGESIAAVEGNPSYVEEGYVEPGYQQYEGATTLVAGSVTYGDYFAPPNDDGVNLFQMTADTVVEEVEFINGVDAQEDVLDHNYRTPQEAADALNLVHTRVRLQLVPLNTGPFENNYMIPVSDLMIPRGIDLEAT